MSYEPQEKYMRRCLSLAAKAAGYTAPNPMVGAVLVHEDRIIGEGWHKEYGGAHAEVNCFNSVKKDDEHLIADSQLYVSLEPCAHFGKTPPCADLIIKKGVKQVVLGVRDPFEQVNGKGIEKLKAANVEVVVGFLEKECFELNKRFFCFHTKARPYIILKWAQTANGIIGLENERLFISNSSSNMLVHKWRSEEAAILVGTTTAMKDDPELNVRHVEGKDPVRAVIDKDLKLSSALKLFSGAQTTVILNAHKESVEGNVIYKKSNFNSLVESIISVCNEMKLLSLLVEGGTKTLQSFINADMWDEARVITNEELSVATGVTAPILSNAKSMSTTKIGTDRIDIYNRVQ
jgi:diaminohydroxyphosphoribosylaminopyrimidine deaminase / 5-amino-6-(5-phosphoribosylamino)uracil reductase